jgi:hypothetical protein
MSVGEGTIAGFATASVVKASAVVAVDTPWDGSTEPTRAGIPAISPWGSRAWQAINTTTCPSSKTTTGNLRELLDLRTFNLPTCNHQHATV